MTMTPLELVAAAKQHITEITPADTHAELTSNVLVDVREPGEYANGKLPGAINIPRGVLEFKLTELPTIPADAKLVVYCQSGGRSALATETLHKLGFTQAVSMAGGFKAWSEAGFPVQ